MTAARIERKDWMRDGYRKNLTGKSASTRIRKIVGIARGQLDTAPDAGTQSDPAGKRLQTSRPRLYLLCR